MIAKRLMVAGSEYGSSKGSLSICFRIPKSQLFCLGALTLLLTLSQNEYCVKGITFTFNGFKGLSDVYTVEYQDFQYWTYNKVNYSITLSTPYDPTYNSIAGRFLYPTPVQMADTVDTTTIKSFSTTFIFQILITGKLPYGVGPGLAFIMVPDKITVGANHDYMGLLTAATSETNKTYASDDHTVGVELDTHMNEEFNDPNNNHICIDVASMNSTEVNTFKPTFPLTTENPERFQQVWIDYIQADSRINIYHAKYPPLRKPDDPLGYQVGVNLSILKPYMYLGFSAATGYESSNLHTILAWSFSNEGEAPQIKIGRDAGSPSPAGSPPAPTPPPTTPAPPGSKAPPSGPVPAPASPPPFVPSSPSPPPPIVSPPPRSPTSPPSPVENNLPGSPSPSAPPPPLFGPPPGPGPGSRWKVIVGSVVGSVSVISILIFLCWWSKFSRRRRKTLNTLEEGMNQDLAPRGPTINSTPTVSTPTVPAPAVPAPTVPAPTVPAPTDSTPTVSTPTVPAPAVPAPTVPTPTVSTPTVSTPTGPADPKLRIFISHTGGIDGRLKIFPINLSRELEENTRYKVFIDRRMRKGVDFPEEILKEIRNTDLGIVVVTEEFFQKKWPMLELVELVELLNTNRVRVLPLFYSLTPDGVRDRLKERHWEEDWRKMSTQRHPIDDETVEKYRTAVETLCNLNGTEYIYIDRSHEADRYKDEVLKAVREIYNEIYPEVIGTGS